jgi:hypothetical protein
MDIDSQHDDSEESRSLSAVDSEQDRADGSKPLVPPRRSQSLSEAPQKPNPRAQNYSEQKRMLLQKSYRDGYADLLRTEATELMIDGVPPVNLEQSQIGVVSWSPSEKEALFQAVSRKSIRDLPQLALAVESKSPPEIQTFLLLLHEKASERHLLHRQTKTISHADIPAAIEISFETEKALESAADAQLAYEDYYEHVAGAQRSPGLWIIDSEAAEELDLEHDQAEEALEPSSADSTLQTPIFHISKFVELSERLFMNYGCSHTHENWRTLAVGNETPAVTQEVISELYDLAVNFTRKLLQTSIFLAQSRQRATANGHYRHQSMIREQDVAAAIQVLKLKCDLWEFWVGVSRRNKLDVFDDKHKQGGSKRGKRMPYDIVEQILSKRKTRWRGRKRSSSANSGTSMTDDEAFDTADQVSQHDENESLSSIDGNSTSDDDEIGVVEAHPLDAILDASSSNDEQDDSSDHLHSTDSSTEGSSSEGSSDGFSGLNLSIASPRQQARHLDLEEEQDAYLEKIDAQESRREEIRLRNILDHENPTSIEPVLEEASPEGKRPKVMRKSTDELTDPLARTKYGAEWELFGAMFPKDSFLETERASKKTKVMPRNTSTRADLSKRRLPLRTRSLSTDTRVTSDMDST